MKEFIKKYYLYILVGVITLTALLVSIDFNIEDEVSYPNMIHEQTEEDNYIYIDIRGSVLNPGVYKVIDGTRLFQLINLAGGFTDDVNEHAVNQSVLLKDEMYIYIPNIYDEYIGVSDQNNDDGSSLVNINTASKSLLDTLPGIGPSTAQNIIDYRTNNGNFKTIEDLMNVPGIGEATFNEIKSKITV